VRRPGPRPLDAALGRALERVAPATVLARVQACWEGVVGEAIARAATPVSERAGTLTVACESAVWAQEIELTGGELVERLNAAMGGPGGPALAAVRARVERRP
jgi:predicted nucleic acid-binding Zn ribbon protein